MEGRRPLIRPSSPEPAEVDRVGYMPQFLRVPAYLCAAPLLLLFRGRVNPIVGTSIRWPLVVNVGWALLLVAAVMQSSAWAFFMWGQVTGISYDEARLAFSAAGGFDIGYWLPLTMGSLVFSVFWITYGWKPDPISFMRGPWLFLLSVKICSDLAVLVTSYLVFKSRTK
jgi:hypothetical protein